MRRLIFFALATAAGAMLASAVAGGAPVFAEGQTFTDIGGNEPYATAVLTLAGDGIVYGRDDGSFSPYDPVTRGELTVYLDRILHLPGSLALPFTDVTSLDWFSGSVASMWEAGLISGTTATTFSPNAPISRQQAAAFVMRSLSYQLARNPASTIDLELPDDQVAAWLAGFQDRALVAPEQAASIANAYRLGLVAGTPDGWFYPSFALSRAQMAVMLYRAFYQPITVASTYPVEVPAVTAYATQSVGSEGVLVDFLESRLAALHYPCGDVDGVYDKCTQDAVMAFEKVEGLPRDGVAGDAVWLRIFTAQTPAPCLSKSGTRVEIDLSRQVLFMIKDDAVTEIVHVSTGKIGTPTGHGSVWLKQTGWQECSVGWMYFPSYFYPHIAIHGSTFVPPYPASHGCIRTPMWIAEHIYYEIPDGTEVDVYY